MKKMICLLAFAVATALAAIVVFGTAWYGPWTKTDYVSSISPFSVYTPDLLRRYPERSVGEVWFDARLSPTAEGAYEAVGPWKVVVSGYFGSSDVISVNIEKIDVVRISDQKIIFAQQDAEALVGAGDLGYRVARIELREKLAADDLGTGIIIRCSILVQRSVGGSQQGTVDINIVRVQTTGVFQVPQL